MVDSEVGRRNCGITDSQNNITAGTDFEFITGGST